MKDLIYKYLLIAIFISTSFAWHNIQAENDYSRQIEIMSQVNTLSQDDKMDDALSYLQSNQSVFDMDLLTKFWYDWLNGIILYQTNRFAESKPYLIDAISFIDDNIDELKTTDMSNYLQIYYYVPDIEFRLGADKPSVVRGLEHAKETYEIFYATENPVYSWITRDLIFYKDDVTSLATLAMNYFLSRNFNDAIPLIQKIILFTQEYQSNDYKHLVVWKKLLAQCYLSLGDYDNSEKEYLSCLSILNKNNLQDEKVYRQVLDAMSILYVNLQNYEKAKYYSNEAKHLYEKALDFGDDYVLCLNNGALVQAGLGYRTVAKMQVDVALRQAKKNLSDSTSFSQNFSELSQFTDQSLQINGLDGNFYIESRIRPYISLLSNASVIYSDLGYLPDAVRAIKESIRLSEEYGLNESLPYNNLGTLYLYRSKYPQAVEWLMKSYSLCRAPYETNEVGFNTALALYLANDSTTASFAEEISSVLRQNVKNMFAFMSGAERAVYWKHFENYLPFLNLMIFDRGNSSNYCSIYDNILEAKGLLLRSTNAIRDAVVKSGSEGDRSDFARLGQLRAQMETELNDSVRTSLTAEIDEIDKRLTRNVNSYADFAKSQSINWQNVRDALTADEGAIEFYNIPLVWGLDSVQSMDGEPRYCALVLKKGYEYPHIIPLCKESELEHLVQEDLYETDSIYNLIWKPLEAELKGVKNVYFAADRELHKIGIEYAPMPDNRIIGDVYNLYRVSSTRVLAEGRKESLSDYAVLYGGLRYDIDKNDLIAESRSGDYHPTSTSRAFAADDTRYGVKYLPGTLKEVNDIAVGFKSTPRVITDIGGTEESFKSLAGSSIDIIHLATHGFFWTEDDADKRSYVSFLKNGADKKSSNEDKALLRSGLFFSGANIGLKGESLPDDVEDGVLTALELSNMNLGHVDMVVMSACQSGLGETSGEGVFGLQRGFKLAGANTLLMSLWKVDDTATQMLMTDFYRNYLSGKSKQESLKLAQQTLRRSPKYSDPEYWAAFILLDGLN